MKQPDTSSEILTDVVQQTVPEAETLSVERLALVCKALGHPARVRIVQHLKEIDRCVCGEIVELFPLAQSTVSQHLKTLKDAGLVRGEVEAPRTCYCLDKDMLTLFKAAIAGL